MNDSHPDMPDPLANGWRKQLALILSRSNVPENDGVDGGSVPLALQFEMRELVPRSSERWNGPTSRSLKSGEEPGSGVYRLGTRPVMRTERGWARGTLTWASIGHHGGRLRLDGDQQRWFRQFYALHRAATTITVGQDQNWVFLDEFVSPALWTLLDQAEHLGIAFVSAGKHTPVQRHTSAEVTVDVRADADGALRVYPRLTVDGAEASFVGTGAIGDHGVYLARNDGDRLVRLAPVAAGLRPAEIALLASDQFSDPTGFVVPASEHEAFFAEGLPGLRQGFRVASEDGSVELPEPSPAGMILTAAWRKGHRLRLEWSVAKNETNERIPALVNLLPQEVFESDVTPDSWDTQEGHESELPKPVELRGVDAAEFMTKVMPLIEGTDGVEVRTTGNPPEYRELGDELKLSVTTVPSEKEDWFDLGVLVTVDGKTVPFAPLFRALAQGRKKLLLVDNSYLHLNHPALTPLSELIAEAQHLDEWETGLRISRYQAAHWAEFEDLADESVAAAEWRSLVREVREMSEEYSEVIDMPGGIRAELRPYQRDGFNWLAFLWRNRLGGVLADDMGLGKTLQCLTLIAHAKESASVGSAGAVSSEDSGASVYRRPAERRPFLVIAPTSVVINWAAEAARFAPDLRVAVRTATEASSGHSVRHDAAEADIVVTSYALFRIDYERYRAVAEDPQLGIAGLILDEAQFVKNAQSQGNQLAAELPVAWKLAVTGTPMENSLRELHALFGIVAPGLFPSARRFEEEYVRAIERPAPGISAGKGAGSGPEAQAGLRSRRIAQLRSRLKPFMLRRTKSLVAAELPEKQEQVLEIELDARHRELYDVFLQRERQKLYGLIKDLDKHRFTVFRSLTLLRMLALDAALIDEQYAEIPSAKLDALTEHTQELAGEGRQTLVFSQFTSFLDLARERLHSSGVLTVTLDGSTRNRDAVIERFRRGEADVFLISLKAGGVGLNLTEADTVFLLDPWWNPASESQAIDRTHRLGQQKPVHVVRMIARGTIEEKVLTLQRRKRDLFDAVIDDEEVFAHSLTASDVRELLG